MVVGRSPIIDKKEAPSIVVTEIIAIRVPSMYVFIEFAIPDMLADSVEHCHYPVRVWTALPDVITWY
jgi:hypothetical protein